MPWSKKFPKADGDYYSRIDEFDKCPTAIRMESGAVYEFGQGGNLCREYQAEDYEYLGPITPEQAEQFDALRKAAEAALTALEQATFHELDATGDRAKRLLRCALGKEQ